MHVSIVLDESGSMESRRVETQQAINAYIAGLFDLPNKDDVKVSLVRFSVDVRETYQALPLNAVTPITDYRPHSITRLLDAIGHAIGLVGADKECVLAVFTDGEENASMEHTYASIKELIEAKQALGWTVLFFGINGFAAVTNTALHLGVHRGTIIGTQPHDPMAASTLSAGALTMAYAVGQRVFDAQKVYNAINQTEEEKTANGHSGNA